MTKIKDLVSLSPGFKAEVNVETDLDNSAKVSAYIPTLQSRDVFDNFARQLHPASTSRSRLLMGTYGTGKSHLALVLARLFSHGADDVMAPILEKLQKWPDVAKELVESRSKVDGRFLLVLLYGDAGPYNDVLLRGLEGALEKAGLSDLLPETAFDAALSRIAAVKADPVLWQRLSGAVQDYGYPSVDALRASLKKKTREAYDRFCELHQAVFAGVPFNHFDFTHPHEVYRAVARRLVDDKTGYKGISIIWDEFGRYMEGVVEDPRGDEGDAMQQFAEKAVNSSGQTQIHLYLVCHRSLRDYQQLSALSRIGAASKADDEAWTRISGRFREFVMTTTDHEVFELIDNVVMQREGTRDWDQFIKSAGEEMEASTTQAQRLRLFPDFGRETIHEVVTEGAYPLHPMTSFMLPRVSQRVAQNSRTLFKFLSHDDASPLGPFINQTEMDGSYVAFPADGLWDYFEHDLTDHPQYRDLMKRFLRAEGLVEPDDALGKRIVRAVALLHLVNSDRAPATSEVICFMLGRAPCEAVTGKLETLCAQDGEGERILTRSVHNQTYRFPGVASDLAEKVTRLANERAAEVQLGNHLRRFAAKLGVPTRTIATAYSDDAGTERWVDVSIAVAAEVADAGSWTAGLDRAPYNDGRLLLVVTESRDEIDRALKSARTELKHPQLILAVPHQPVPFSQLALRHETLIHLEATEAHLYGRGAPLRSEWEEHLEDYSDALSRAIGELLKPDSRLVDWWADGSQLEGVTLQSKLSAAVSAMMRRVFGSTPRLGPAKLTSDEGNDTYAKIRRPIIDKIIRQDGPQLLSKETAKEQLSVINQFFERNGVLVKSGQRSILRRPDEAAHPEMAAVWDEIARFIAQAREDGTVSMQELVDVLCRPPYGLRARSIPLLFAVVAREHFIRSNISFSVPVGRGSGIINSPDAKVIDDAVLNPARYILVYTDIGHMQQAILDGVADAFGIPTDGTADAGKLIDVIRQEIHRWWLQLDRYAQTTDRFDPQTGWLRDRVLGPIGQGDTDPKPMLLDLLPTRLQVPDGRSLTARDVRKFVSTVKTTLEGASSLLATEALACMEQELTGSSSDDPAATITGWAGSLSSSLVARPQYGDSDALLSVVRKARKGGLERQDLLELAHSLSGIPLDNWDDSTLDRLGGHLESVKRYLETCDAPTPVIPDEDQVVVPRPDGDMVRVVVVGRDSIEERNIKHTGELSVAAENTLKVMRGQLAGMKGSMGPGEIEQVLLALIEEFM